VTPLPDGSGNITSGVIGPTDTTAQSIAGNYVHVFNPLLLNELRVGYTRRRSSGRRRSLIHHLRRVSTFPEYRRTAPLNTLPAFAVAGLQQIGPSANTASDFVPM
jgi:hypothetical protein